MSYITYVQPDENDLKKVETCRFIKHLKNVFASNISYITVKQSCLGSDVFTVSLNKRLTNLLGYVTMTVIISLTHN
jgi:hypothetical protein